MSYETVTVTNDTGKEMLYFIYKADQMIHLSRSQVTGTLLDGESLPVINGIVNKSPKQRMFSNQPDFFAGKPALVGYITIKTRDGTIYEVPESSIKQSKSVTEHRTPIIKYGGSVGNAQKAIQEKIKASTVYIGGGQSVSTYEHKPEYVFSTRFGQWLVNKDAKNPLSFLEVHEADVPDSNFTITYKNKENDNYPVHIVYVKNNNQDRSITYYTSTISGPIRVKQHQLLPGTEFKVVGEVNLNLQPNGSIASDYDETERYIGIWTETLYYEVPYNAARPYGNSVFKFRASPKKSRKSPKKGKKSPKKSRKSPKKSRKSPKKSRK